MRLDTDATIENMKIDDMKMFISDMDEVLDDGTISIKDQVKQLQRTRHLMFWHDGSTVSNHSHLMMMVSCMYDRAVYITDNEAYCKYNERINVQAFIEKAYLYILARCPSNDQQLLYGEERVSDLLDLKQPIKS